MALSMTGYGSETFNNKELYLKCEILCLNKKNLEVNVNLPRYALMFELDIRKIVKEQLIRGKATLNYDIRSATGKKNIKLNESLFKTWNQALNTTSKKHNIENDLTMADWFSMPEIWSKENTHIPTELLKKTLFSVTKKACKKLIAMRIKEGKNLQKDILKRLKKIETLINDIKKLAPAYLKKYKNKIKKQVKGSNNFNRAEIELFNRFTSVFSNKADITEEIIRLKSHISQFKSFTSSEKPVGRPLDFLLQEFLREANTITSKSNNLKISRNIVEMKTLLEQIREQIQNIL